MATGVRDHEPVTDQATVFRAFERGEFLEWPAWKRLHKILNSNGGSYGLSGPRGAGKSWLMLRAIEWTENPTADEPREPGLGLWYPSPSEYDPLAFLASLSDSLATKIERWYRRSERVQAKRQLLRAIPALAPFIGVFLAVAVAVDWSLTRWCGGSWPARSRPP